MLQLPFGLHDIGKIIKMSQTLKWVIEEGNLDVSALPVLVTLGLYQRRCSSLSDIWSPTTSS